MNLTHTGGQSKCHGTRLHLTPGFSSCFSCHRALDSEHDDDRLGDVEPSNFIKDFKKNYYRQTKQ